MNTCWPLSAIWSFGFVFAVGALPLTAQETLDFNRDIRPILSDKCFACHGQDANQRQAELRLDVPPENESSQQIISAGNVADSELVRRIESQDVEVMMPPPASNKRLSSTERELLKRWVADGAKYARHWAFVAPAKASLPDGVNPVDYFVSARLAEQGWSLSPAAPPETWLRRVALDLTGLPPTVDEIDRFLELAKREGETAYAQTVDRLLASPRYGERMAQEWLDVARYADTHGFNNDSARTMWRWRDWVIEAFQRNLPYDQFITEQLAGDLLANATLDQRIATGFCRNHVINSEGGIIEEEYRVEYVADRVRTMSTAWLGLTMECSRCHDHKFDPITQEDYYSLFAFFNNVPEHGEDGRIANAVPMIPAPTRQQQAQLDAKKRTIDQLDQQLDALRLGFIKELARRARTTVEEAGSDGASNDSVKVQPPAAATPKSEPAAAGTPSDSTGSPAPTAVPDATLSLDGESDQPIDKVFKFQGQAPNLIGGVQGSAWHMTAASGIVEIASGKINLGKRGTVSMWIKPDVDCPREVALLSSVNYQGNATAQGFAKGHEIRLVDGEIEVRTNDTFPAYAIRLRSQGAQIVAGQWRHLAVVMGGTKKAVDIQVQVDGQPLLVHTSYDGLSSDSIAGNAVYNLGSERTPGAAAYRGAIDQFEFYSQGLKTAEVQQAMARTAWPFLQKRVRMHEADHREQMHVADRLLAAENPYFASLQVKRSGLWSEYLEQYRNLPTAMVMQELPEPRATFVLKRGAYDAHGQQVRAAVPERLLAPWPEGAPRNRLGLARWLTSPDHPLTARVVVNRFWAQLFGAGLVRTLEDFGYQGEYPSHPALLDWLARDFVEHGWDTQRLLRTIVLSQTYRQASRVTQEQLAGDPDNRLLARMPRLRLSAEMLRDQALAVSGLLKERVGGPSVYPYQPDGLYTGLVVGADYPGTNWTTSQGDDLFRRTMYTFWKRTVPHPVMQTFDAPDREFCMVRRSRTNTPLQALTLMNEPGFYQAAQELGKKIESQGGADDAARVTWAFRQVTARMPSEAERGELLQAWNRLRAADPANANTLLASILLNLDETVTRE